MSAIVKTKLKRARDAIGKKDYEGARSAATEVLSYEPDNYNANVFLGLSLFELGQHEQSEQAYRKAIDSSPGQILAWQGISKFYEQTQQWEKYVETLQSLIELHTKSEDAVKCAEALQRFIEFQRQQGSRAQVIDALYRLLPGSTLYPLLSNLPAPDATSPTLTTTFAIQTAIHNSLPVIEEIVHLIETEEDEAYKKEVDKRRMRLGASGPEELRKEVGREIWGASKLPELYGEILNHPNTSDDLRRTTESKLLRYTRRYQHALPLTGDFASLKIEAGKKVDELVNGVVLLNLPDELAWEIYIEGKDSNSIEDYDLGILRRFRGLFPSSPLSKLIQGYFQYVGIAYREEDEDEEALSSVPPVEEAQDPFDTVLEAFESLQDSIFSHRIIGDIYSREEDHQNAIRLAERGLELVLGFETDTAKKLPHVRKAFNVILATGLVHLFPPKHHVRALRIVDDVLDQESDNIPCLMGRAYILQAASRWHDAAAFFDRVVKKLPGDLDVGLEAKEEHAWCQVQAGTLNIGANALLEVRDQLEELDGNDTRKARVWWRLGQCYWDLGEGTREESYQYFITSLKRSPAFAPAFTSLGIYYLEYASPPDPTRASKCFQKAFELDSREADAARRLAEGFAEEREWDLVEVVARRTIEGEGGLEGGIGENQKAAMARYKPTNAWAWKAVGVVELNRRNYAPAIEAFQLALRTEPKDGLSWLRLGESYTKAGRHAAALKALVRSQELRPDDWMCLYQMGEVLRQTGQLKEATESFESILLTRPTECGVLVSLAEAYLSLGRSQSTTGFLARAESSFLSSISVAYRVIDSSPGFRRVIWKTIADALLELSEFSAFSDPQALLKTILELVPIYSSSADKRLAGLIEHPFISDAAPIDGLVALKVAVATCSYRITFFPKDDDAIGSAWFELGLSLSRLSTRTGNVAVKEKAHKDAIEYVRRAVAMNPGNTTFWSVLGNLNFDLHPKMAQHAYIMALEIDAKNVVVWTSLGLLYLQNDDPILANEAFYRAQTLDPDYTLAWVGQGLVESANGREPEATALFEHAVGLSADVPQVDLEYAYRVFRRLATLDSVRTSPIETLLPPFFSLDRYCRRRSDDPSALHLFGLVCERLGHVDLSVHLISDAIGLLESVYEETEDAEIEKRYATANANLGRLRLVTKDHGGALEAFEIAFGLLSDDYDDIQTVTLRAMCQFGSGLAHFHLGNPGDAIPLFESALEIAGDHSVVRGHITVLLSQTLWAMGTEEYQESAKSQLLQCITNDPENLTAVTALAGMGLLTDDEALVDAALAEILALPMDQRQERDPERDVANMLTRHYLSQSDIARVSSLAQQAVHAEPSRQSRRQDLASLAVHQGRPSDARALLSRALDASLEDNPSEMHHSLRIVAIALAADDEEAIKPAQKAIMLAPWDLNNWRCLAYVRNRGATQ